MLQPGDGTKRKMEITLLLNPHILEVQPERIHVTDVFTPFNTDTDKEQSWSIFYFLVKSNSLKLY